LRVSFGTLFVINSGRISQRQGSEQLPESEVNCNATKCCAIGPCTVLATSLLFLLQPSTIKTITCSSKAILFWSLKNQSSLCHSLSLTTKTRIKKSRNLFDFLSQKAYNHLHGLPI